jgi:uncharacterized phiE125 gp8 family phage protein
MDGYTGTADGYTGWGTSARDRAAAAASNWVVEIQPAFEPLTLAELKLHVRETSPDRDADLYGKLIAARDTAERRTGRAIPAQTRRLTLEVLPRAWGGVGAYPGWREASRVRLPGPPLLAVSQIDYDDAAAGSFQVLSPSAYRVNGDREPAVIEPVFGQFWPVTRIQTGAVRVHYRCGWPITSVAAPIAAGQQTVTPADMTGIVPGTSLTVTAAVTDPTALTDFESVLVTAVTSTTFTATFAKAHNAGAVVNAVPVMLREAMKMIVDHGQRFAGGDDEGGRTSALDIPPRAADILEGFWVGDY